MVSSWINFLKWKKDAALAPKTASFLRARATLLIRASRDLANSRGKLSPGTSPLLESLRTLERVTLNQRHHLPKPLIASQPSALPSILYIQNHLLAQQSRTTQTCSLFGSTHISFVAQNNLITRSKYQNDDREFVDIKHRHINEHPKEVMGARFTAKDFRTWAGTLVCACALARAGTELVEKPSSPKRKIVAAIKETATTLGNTPSVCRSSYSPGVIKSFERARMYERIMEEYLASRAAAWHSCRHLAPVPTFKPAPPIPEADKINDEEFHGHYSNRSLRRVSLP